MIITLLGEKENGKLFEVSFVAPSTEQEADTYLANSLYTLKKEAKPTYFIVWDRYGLGKIEELTGKKIINYLNENYI